MSERNKRVLITKNTLNRQNIQNVAILCNLTVSNDIKMAGEWNGLCRMETNAIGRQKKEK